MNNLKGLIKIPNFISKSEAMAMVKECEFKLRKIKKYSNSHFDNVIRGYKEVQPSLLSPEFESILDRMKIQANAVLGSTDIKYNVHILELAAENSEIMAHTDNNTGRIVAGLCLLSPCVMIFRNGNQSHSILLEENTFYMQYGELRYKYTHEIPNSSSPDHSINGSLIKRGRRISVMIREELTAKN